VENGEVKLGNPADVVELEASIALDTLSDSSKQEMFQERIDWWLEMGGEEYVQRFQGSMHTYSTDYGRSHLTRGSIALILP
jgi:hypothetical protein